MKCVSSVLLVGGMILSGSAASAQDWGRPPVPRSGACFYENKNYGGRYFCYRAGDDTSLVPNGTNDQISSIRLFGDAAVVVYKDKNFHGDSRRITSDMGDLRREGWNDRISSIRVNGRSSGWGNGGGGNGNGGGRLTYAQAQSIVQRAYRSVLGRDPDPGASGWIDTVMRDGMTQRQLELELMKSDEYHQKHR